MKLRDLSPEVIERIKARRWDRIIEKHEGPETWASVFRYAQLEFITVNGHQVLLPVDREQHPKITILRCLESRDGKSLTIFLKDLTYVTDPRDEKFYAGFVAVCDRFPGEDFFQAILYHEWFIIEAEQ
jgi:hypothetical protein